MAYSNFTLDSVQSTFGLAIDEHRDLFADVEKIQPSAYLSMGLAENVELATTIGTEKARSEFAIAPVLAEVRRQMGFQVSLFSGTEFNVDPEQGLGGFCDFILSAAKEQLFITAPVAIVVEAKREDIIAGIGQCVAAMLAAQIFNQRKCNQLPVIYGAVTSGTNWRFLILEERLVRIDLTEYYIKEVDKILGILIQPLKQHLAGNIHRD